MRRRDHPLMVRRPNTMVYHGRDGTQLYTLLLGFLGLLIYARQAKRQGTWPRCAQEPDFSCHTHRKYIQKPLKSRHLGIADNAAWSQWCMQYRDSTVVLHVCMHIARVYMRLNTKYRNHKNRSELNTQIRQKRRGIRTLSYN